MDLGIREAAALLGRSQRTLRAQLARGEIAGTKTRGRWRISHRELPLTEAQRVALQARAERIRETVEQALPRAVRAPDRKNARSVLDLDTFRLGSTLLEQMRSETEACKPTEAMADLENALLSLCEATHAYDPGMKLEFFQKARRLLSTCAGRLILAGPIAGPSSHLPWVERIEKEVLPSLSGLIRWSERRERKGR